MGAPSLLLRHTQPPIFEPSLGGWLPAFMSAIFRAEYTWHLATALAETPALARGWLESAGPNEFDPATSLRAEAAVLAEGRVAEAAAKAREGLRALSGKSMLPTRNVLATEQLEVLLARAK